MNRRVGAGRRTQGRCRRRARRTGRGAQQAEHGNGVLTADVDLAVGNRGRCELDGRTGHVAITGGLVARIEQAAEIRRVVGVEHLATDAVAAGRRIIFAVYGPNDAVARAVGGNRWRGTGEREDLRSLGGRCGRYRARRGVHAKGRHALILAAIIKMPIPISRRAPNAARYFRDLLDDLRIARRAVGGYHAVLAQIRRVQDIQGAELSHLDDFLRVRAVGDQDRCTRGHVDVADLQGRLIVRREIVEQREAAAGGRPEFEHAVGEIARAVPGAVAGREVQVAGSVGRNAATPHPNAALDAVWRGVENRFLSK